MARDEKARNRKQQQEEALAARMIENSKVGADSDACNAYDEGQGTRDSDSGWPP